MPEKIRITIREQIITIISTLSAILAGITTIILSVIGNFRGGGGVGGPPSKDKGALKKWLDRLAKGSQEKQLKHCLLLWEVLLVRF